MPRYERKQQSRMEHPGEIWQELDYNGDRLGGIEPVKFDESKVKLFYGTAIMLYRFKDGEVEYLFQHRSRFLKGNPDKWDTSAGGHVNLNEKRIDAARREAREEIGAEIDAGKLEIVAIYRRWNVMVALYFYDWGDRKDEFHFDDEEVEEVKWVKYSELDEFLPNLKTSVREDKIFMYYLKEWNARILEKHENT